MRSAFRLIVIGSLFALVLACGGEGNLFNGFADESSDEAMDYQAQMDLDAGNYDAVIDYLGDKNPGSLTEEEAIILASAHLGSAGMDLLNLLEITGGDNSTGSSFGTISALLGGSTLSEGDFDNKSAAITASLNVLGLQADNDSKTLAGVGAALDTVLVVAEVYGHATGFPVDLESMTSDNLSGIDNTTLLTAIGNVDNASERITTDLTTLGGTIDTLTGNDNFQDLNQDLQDFTNEIDNNTDDNVTDDELINYLRNL